MNHSLAQGNVLATQNNLIWANISNQGEVAWCDAAELSARVVQRIFLTVFLGPGEVPAGILTKPLVPLLGSHE